MRQSADSNQSKRWSKKEFINLLFNTPTPVIADAMEGSNVLGCLKPLAADAMVAGPIVTAKTSATDWGTVVHAIEGASPGDVLFIDSSGSDASVWGGLASRAALRQGLAGTIVYGSCRDVSTIKRLGYPVWSRSITPRAGGPLGRGKVNVPLIIHGISIRPHDFVKADAEGVAIIPSQEREPIATNITQITQKEQILADGLKTGKKFSELLSGFYA